MMEGWKRWEGKKIFIRTNKDRTYSGIVGEVVDVGNGLAFISFRDRFDMWVTVATTEIAEIKEER